MENFIYHAPTRVYFGRGAVKELPQFLQAFGCRKVLLHYGGTSARRSGLLDQITGLFKQIALPYVELGGVAPNPRIDLIREGVSLCQREGVDFILAVGGGSVIDSAKGISLSLTMGRDDWELIETQTMPDRPVVPVAAVLTIAAAGSEMSYSHVVTNAALHKKRSLNHDRLRPVAAFMDPELTYSVSPYQTACGVVDIMMHTLERYLAPSAPVPLTDRIAEGLLLSVKEAGTAAMENPKDYKARATLMWASSLSHNGITGCGKVAGGFPAHKLEHDLSGLFDVAHGAGLAVIFPAWAQYIYRYDLPKFARLAEAVWDITQGTEEEKALAGIQAMRQYFQSIGMPVTLGELGISSADYEKIADLTTDGGTKAVPSYIPLTKADILRIYQLAQ